MDDFYEVLGISSSATASEIKQAYRKRSLETHPDRFPVGSREQRDATARFQEVNDAYYVLSDAERRRDYDAKRASENAAGSGFASWSSAESRPGSDTRANAQFGSTFEEMMAEQGLQDKLKDGHYYSVSGGAAGAVLGFIVANVPGALAGAVAGYRLGHIRDTSGKAVYEVFQELPHAEKAKWLALLLTKVVTQLS